MTASVPIAPIASPRSVSEAIMMRRRSKRSLTTPPKSTSRACGNDIAILTTASAAGAPESVYTCQASATRKIPSPISEMLAPVQRSRKSRSSSGASSLTRRASAPSMLGRDVLAAGEQLLDLRAQRRLGEVVPLRAVAAEAQKLVELPGALDSLGHRHEAEHLGHVDDRGGERELLRALVDVVDERLVDLEDVDRKLPDVAERGVAGAEVVDRDDRGGERELLRALVDVVDERLVDLEDVDRKLPDVAERGVAGAEVVDR